MAYFISSPKVGRSQGASIFWGLISVCFAAAACFYYWKNHENETTANVMRDQVLQLREQTESLNAEKEHLLASKTEAENELKTREDLVDEKETQLAAEEANLDSQGHQSQAQSQQNQAQVLMVKKFDEAIRKIGTKDNPPDVVERGGRPVLRLPNAQLFNPGESTLKPEGKVLLGQIAQSIIGQVETFELRIVCYTDTEAEASPTGAQNANPASKAKPTSSWDLTAARSAALARYFHDESTLPFRNVRIEARGDSEPIVSNASDEHARNRRVEISVTPLPAPFYPPSTDPVVAGSTTANDTATATENDPTPAKKAKPKKAEKDESSPN